MVGERQATIDGERGTRSDPQCRIKVGAIDAAALGPFVKQAHGADAIF